MRRASLIVANAMFVWTPLLTFEVALEIFIANHWTWIANWAKNKIKILYFFFAKLPNKSYESQFYYSYNSHKCYEVKTNSNLLHNLLKRAVYTLA